jgi:YesN/AraC family two-component response regulator
MAPASFKPYFFFKSIKDYPYIIPNEHLYLVNLGYEKCPPKFQFSNSYDYYRIYTIKSGSGTLKINDSTYHLSPNDTFLILPNQVITKQASDSSTLEYCFFAFNGSLSKEMLDHTLFQQTPYIQFSNNRLSASIIEATQELKHEDFSTFWGLEQLFHFLSYLAIPEHTDASVSAEPISFSRQHFFTAKEYIDLYYYKPLRIEDICQIVGLNRSYLFRLFEKYTASSIMDYLTDVRLKHAKELLLTTDHSTTIVSKLVGYINPTSFYRMFKRKENMTPSQWKELHKE